MRLTRRGIAAAAVAALSLGLTGPLGGPVEGITRRPRTRPRVTRARVTTTRVPARTRSISTVTVDAARLGEVSGCAFSRRDPNLVWLHNDSGDTARVFPVDVSTGVVGPAVEVAGVDVADAEDIAITPGGDLVLADIGDNDERRADVALVRFPEPAPGSRSASGTVTRYSYPDGPRDAEALLIEPDGASALVITKSATGRSQVFRADLSADPKLPGVHPMTQVGELTISGEGFFFPNLVTAADTVGGGSAIVVRTYAYGYLFRRPTGAPFERALEATPERFDLPGMIQAEAICSSPDGTRLVTTTEARGAATFPLSVVPVPR